MWSHLYWYYEIRGNETYSQQLLTNDVLAIIVSKSTPENETFYISLLTDIAEKINWELILEEDDNDNENVVLRKKTP